MYDLQKDDNLIALTHYQNQSKNVYSVALGFVQCSTVRVSTIWVRSTLFQNTIN